MFPITPIEIGPGFVIGKERVVSKVERTFDAPSAPYDTFGDIGGALAENIGMPHSSTRKVVPISPNPLYAGPIMVHYFGTGGFRTRVQSLQGSTSVELKLRGVDRLAVIVW
jgi:hypothetical protein